MSNHDWALTAGLAHPLNHLATVAALPAELRQVALIDGPTAAAAGTMSVSWWHAKVAALEAPQPVIRGPRCTRWRVADVAAFWRDWAERGASQAGADAVLSKSRRASAAAKAVRVAKPVDGGQQ